MKFASPQFTSRINALDLVRGWCLVVIAADHLTRFPSLFDPLTGRGLLWVTAAEGFFFISGMLVGVARGKDVVQSGLGVATKKLWVRAAKLFLASVVLTLVFTASGLWLQSLGVTAIKSGAMAFGSVWELVYKTITLQYNYGWADFLNYYVVYLVLSPVALWLLRRRLWWVVVWVALTVWLLKTAVPLPFPFWYGIWQAYFFLGVVCGFHLDSLRKLGRSLTLPIRRIGRRGLVGAAAVTVAASFAFTFGTEFFEGPGRALGPLLAVLHLPSPTAFHSFFYSVKEDETFKALFQNVRAGLLRLPIFFVWIGALFVIVRRFEPWIMRRLGWLLLPLGRNSLYVYIIQSLVIFGILLIPLPATFVVNTLVVVTTIGLSWLAVRTRFLFRIIPR